MSWAVAFSVAYLLYMWQTLLEILLYGSLGANLLGYADVAPDARFEIALTPTQAAAGEIIDVTLILKTNTPIESITGSARYDTDGLQLQVAQGRSEFYKVHTDSSFDGEVTYEITSSETTATGMQPVLALSFVATTAGPQTVTFSDIEAVATLDQTHFYTPQLSHTFTITEKDAVERLWPFFPFTLFLNTN